MIKAIIFDLGGVVIKHRSDIMPFLIGSVFHLENEKARAVWHEHKDAMLTGELPSLEFIEKVKSDMKMTIPTQTLFQTWKYLYEQEAGELNTPLLEAIRTLRKSYAVYLLTDTIEVHHKFNDDRGLYAHFDGAFCSHIEKKSKSQGVQVFEQFLKKFGLRAEDCVFIDDLKNYAALSESVGIRGIVYTNNDKLFHDFASLGIHL